MKGLSATRAVLEEIDCTVSVFKKGYVDLVQVLAGEVKDARQSSEVYRCKVAKRDGKIEKIDVKKQ